MTRPIATADSETPSPQGPSSRSWRSLGSVLFVQTQNAFNDNLVKFVLIGLALAVAAGTPIGDNIQYILTALIPIPFILLAPVAGFCSDRWSKNRVLWLCLVTQVLIVGLIAFAVWQQNIVLAVVGFFLLAVQSTLFSPAKQGILKELVGSSRLGFANGLMQMLVMIGILGGMFLGGRWFDGLLAEGVDPWRAALVPIGVIAAASFVPLGVGWFIQSTPSHPETRFRPGILVSHFADLGYLLRHRTLRLTALGMFFYWYVANFMGLAFIGFGKQLHPDFAAGGASSATANMLAIVGIGLMAGSTLVSLISRKRLELGMVPFGGIGLAIGILGTSQFEPGTGLFHASIAFIGFSGAFFLVPLAAFLQDQAAEEHRGRVLSANNLLASFAGILAIATGFGLDKLGLKPSTQVLLFVLPTVVVAFVAMRIMPRRTLHFLFALLLSFVYRIRVLHADRVPKEGGVILVGNHVSYIDAFLMTAASPRDIRFLMIERYRDIWWAAWFLRIFDVIFISPHRAAEAIKSSVEALQEGAVVCIFPEGQLSRTGMLNELKRGFELMARGAKVPVVPVYMDGLWGSIFSFERGRYLQKLPRQVPYRMTVCYGEPIPAREARAPVVRQKLLSLSVEALGERRELKLTLAAAATDSLKKHRRRNAIVDRTGKGLSLSRGMLLATAEAIAARWRREQVFKDGEERVGILLPLGAPQMVLHLALTLAGKVPVVFPFEQAPDARTLEKWGIRTMISSHRIQEQITAFPWPDGFIDMAESFKEVPRGRLLFRWLRVWLEPRPLAVKRRRKVGGNVDDVAAAYVLPGIDGNPILVNMSHRQITANVSQIASTYFIRSRDVILSELPPNLAAGNIFSLWHPILAGKTLVTLAMDTDDEGLRRAIREEGVTVCFPGARRWPGLFGGEWSDGDDPEADASLRLMTSFIEAHAAEECLNSVEESVGATLAVGTAHDLQGVVISLSQASPNHDSFSGLPQHGARTGAVGRLVPGIEGRIQSEGESGPLQLKGPCFADSEAWLETGREARFDDEGFLFLEPELAPGENFPTTVEER